MTKLGNEHPAARPVMVIVYLLAIAVGIGGLSSFGGYSLAPFDDLMLRTSYTLFLLGGVAGVASIPTVFWWLERGAIFFLLSALVLLLVPLVFNQTPVGVKVVNGSLLGIIGCGLVYRFIRISGLWTAPKQSGRRHVS